MERYHCGHVAWTLLRDPPRMAFVHEQEVLWECPVNPRPHGDFLHTRHLPRIAGNCPECGQPFGWRVWEADQQRMPVGWEHVVE